MSAFGGKADISMSVICRLPAEPPNFGSRYACALKMAVESRGLLGAIDLEPEKARRITSGELLK
jgi:hypothetical protein